MSTENIISCSIPQDLTPLSPNGFMLSISKLPDVTFFAQSVNLPGITLGDPQFANPFRNQPIPGETLTYDNLEVQFLVDQKMLNYRTIYNWIVALGFPETYQQYITLVQGDTTNYSELATNYSDATLSVLTGTNQVAQQINFIDMFPVSLDSINFASTNTDVQYVVGRVTFAYGYYKLI